LNKANTSPADLNKRITLQYQTKVPDGAGGFTVSWADAATIFAAIWPISANEQVQALGQTMTITHRIRIRYRNTIKASWRISYAGKYFNIVSIIDPNISHRWLDILVKEAA
jgi:SPP1 family predicted phage head-tail adaptor